MHGRTACNVFRKEAGHWPLILLWFTVSNNSSWWSLLAGCGASFFYFLYDKWRDNTWRITNLQYIRSITCGANHEIKTKINTWHGIKCHAWNTEQIIVGYGVDGVDLHTCITSKYYIPYVLAHSCAVCVHVGVSAVQDFNIMFYSTY